MFVHFFTNIALTKNYEILHNYNLYRKDMQNANTYVLNYLHQKTLKIIFHNTKGDYSITMVNSRHENLSCDKY